MDPMPSRIPADKTPRRTHHNPDGMLELCIWAPKRKIVSVEFQHGVDWRRHPMERTDDGHFHLLLDVADRNARYRFVLDNELIRPDPASRFQPQGVHGPSQLVDLAAYPWTDEPWTGVPKRDLVIYEMHVGAFTIEGTLRSAIGRLDELVDLGVTAIELLPVAQSPGRWNWGYDGVAMYAVRSTFGGPDALCEFVDKCHQRGLAVILDVVYNHLGPEGNYLADFGPYFSSRHRTPWGDAFNFDGRNSREVRQYVVENAIYWLRDYHLDGLRLDAVHFMFDDSPVSILSEIRDAVADFKKTVNRQIHLIAEANIFDPELLPQGQPTPIEQAPIEQAAIAQAAIEQGPDQVPRAQEARGHYDAIWCDDLMHAIYSVSVPGLRLTPRTYDGLADVHETLCHGYLYSVPKAERMVRDEHQKANRADDLSHLDSLVFALQTHDSVGNHPHGKRIHELASSDLQRAAAALILLYPAIPMIFMGEEGSTMARFPFFADFEDPGLRKAVDAGRRHEYPDHEWDGAVLPSAPAAFEAANVARSGAHVQTWQWYQTLLRIRREWRAAGDLSHATLSVSRFGDILLISYSNDHFLLVNIAEAENRPQPNFSWTGERYADSRRVTTSMVETGNLTNNLTSPQAIIGRGRVTVSF
jgi:maltooligosyltrehalose trehalohydrolase